MIDVSNQDLQSLLLDGYFPSEDFKFDETKLCEADAETYRNVRFKYQRNTDLYMYADTDVNVIRAFDRLNISGEEALGLSIYGTEIPNFYNRVEAGNSTFGESHPAYHQQTYRYALKKHPLFILKRDGTKTLTFFANNIHSFKLIGGKCSFEVGEIIFNFEELPSDDFPEVGRYRPTHKIKIEYNVLEGVTFEQIVDDFHLIKNALTLISGQYAGVGHLIGCDSSDKETAMMIGFTSCDPALNSSSNWYRMDPKIKIRKVFEGLLKLRNERNDYDVVCRALHYYRASNTVVSAREVALVSSCSGVEALIGHYLRDRAGWTRSLVNKSSLAERMAAASSLIGMSKDILDDCPKLLARSRAENYTGFEIIALFRNKLVHSVPEFNYDGQELLEAYNLFQWFLEMLLLASIGYVGGYQNRRRYTGFFQTDDVPYTKLLIS